MFNRKLLFLLLLILPSLLFARTWQLKSGTRVSGTLIEYDKTDGYVYIKNDATGKPAKLKFESLISADQRFVMNAIDGIDPVEEIEEIDPEEPVIDPIEPGDDGDDGDWNNEENWDDENEFGGDIPANGNNGGFAGGGFMAIVCFGLILIGLLVNTVGSIWLIVVAFRTSIIWGLMYLFVPFAALIFIIQNWQEAKKPFLISLLGGVIMVMGLCIAGPLSG